jgi:hypothetical protein
VKTESVLIVVALLAACGSLSLALMTEGLIEGISFVAWWEGLYSSPEADRSLESLTKTGANWMALIVTCYQEDLRSTEIRCPTGSRTPTDDDLRHAIRKAKELGLKVLLKPHLDLNNDSAHWRGEISFNNEAAWAAWFASYEEFILHYAELAEAEGAALFSVGCELQGTTRREADWRRIISKVQGVYAGPLIYAANWGGEEGGSTSGMRSITSASTVTTRSPTRRIRHRRN